LRRRKGKKKKRKELLGLNSRNKNRLRFSQKVKANKWFNRKERHWVVIRVREGRLIVSRVRREVIRINSLIMMMILMIKKTVKVMIQTIKEIKNSNQPKNN
jgi:hypothetical protein